MLCQPYRSESKSTSEAQDARPWNLPWLPIPSSAYIHTRKEDGIRQPSEEPWLGGQPRPSQPRQRSDATVFYTNTSYSSALKRVERWVVTVYE